MARHQNTEIIDKQSSIKHYMQNTLWLKNIIDAGGNILNLDRFRAEVDVAISNCEIRMTQYTSVDGVVTDREKYSILVGELEYLQDLAKHTTNFYPLKQNPIVSHEDLPKTNRDLIKRIQKFCKSIKHKISDTHTR